MRTPHLPRAVAAPLVLVLGFGLAACGTGDGGTSGAPGSRTRSLNQGPTTPAPGQTGAAPTSDVEGRRHDVGTITDHDQLRGVTVLVVDRWTVKGLDDAKLAEDGATIAPHDGNLFTNQNSEKTYEVPVATGAIAVVNECVEGQPPTLRSEPQPAVEWADDAPDDEVVYLTYDDRGRLTRIDTDPRCD